MTEAHGEQKDALSTVREISNNSVHHLHTCEMKSFLEVSRRAIKEMLVVKEEEIEETSLSN